MRCLLLLLLFSLLAAVTAWQLDPNCGIKGPEEAIEGRIIGGQKAAPHEFPWQVQQVFPMSRQIHCGASVLNKDWLITAGHCAAGNSMPYYFGTNQAPITGEPADATIRLAAKFIVHPQLSLHPDASPKHDIALVKLAQPLPLSNASAHIQPICLPEADEEDDLNVHAGSPATISGFGETKIGVPSNVLLKVNATIWTQQDCVNAWTVIPPNYTVTEKMICALSYGKGACHGDSGGPMTTYNERTGRWQLTGIVSWGQPACDSPFYPNVYTRVSKYLDWIKATIEAN